MAGFLRTPWRTVERLMNALPQNILSAMIAGVLLPICIKLLQALHADPAFILPLVLAYLLGRRFMPRYAVACALLAGMVSLVPQILVMKQAPQMTFATPLITAPVLSSTALLGLGIAIQAAFI